MPPLYIGGSNLGDVGKPGPWLGPGPPRRGPFVGDTPPQTPGNVLPAQAVRPTGPSGGFDPQYLQNLATAIGGLFSRPSGNLSFNPLGNLSDVSSPGLGFGNAPLPGLPSTWLQDAINGLSFNFSPFTFGPPATPPASNGGNGSNNGRGRILQ